MVRNTQLQHNRLFLIVIAVVVHTIVEPKATRNYQRGYVPGTGQSE